MYDLETMGTVKNQVKVPDANVEDFDDIDEENQNIFQNYNYEDSLAKSMVHGDQNINEE
jgi:hypothetical protein